MKIEAVDVFMFGFLAIVGYAVIKIVNQKGD